MRFRMSRTTSLGRGAVCALAVVTALSSSLRAEVFDWGFHFVEEPVSARHLAMGSAGTALGGGGFFFYNPAQPFLRMGHYLSVEYGQLHSDLRRGRFETGWILPNWYVAAGIPTSAVSDIIPADETGPNYNVPFSAQFSMIALDVGYYKERYSLALCFNGMQDKIEARSGYALSVSAGAALWAIPGKLSLGAAGFFPKAITTTKGMLGSTDEWGKGADLPQLGRVGAAWRDTLKGIAYTTALDVTYRHEDKKVTVPVGVEVWPLWMLALRAGKRIGHDTEIVNLGLGFRMAPASVDAGFVVSRLVEDAELKWLVGLNYALGRTGESAQAE